MANYSGCSLKMVMFQWVLYGYLPEVHVLISPSRMPQKSPPGTAIIACGRAKQWQIVSVISGARGFHSWAFLVIHLAMRDDFLGILRGTKIFGGSSINQLSTLILGYLHVGVSENMRVPKKKVAFRSHKKQMCLFLMLAVPYFRYGEHIQRSP